MRSRDFATWLASAILFFVPSSAAWPQVRIVDPWPDPAALPRSAAIVVIMMRRKRSKHA